jgi:hypothetical protein
MRKKTARLLVIPAITLLFLSAFSPAVFAYTATEISGNGTDSTNTAVVTKDQSVVVVQDNFAHIENRINANTSTGENRANDNTGGDVTVNTGSATSNVNVENKVNANIAQVEECDGCENAIEATISGNGSYSDNTAIINSFTDTAVYQDNFACIDNDVNANPSTGENEADRNTGGAVNVTTGPATANVNVSNQANANLAEIGDDGPSSDAGWVAARIVNNGSNSDNFVNVNLDRFALITQDNFARIDNRINANPSTGNNSANDNTDGDVAIRTGSATSNVNVDNRANFNYADIECCGTDHLTEVEGNGSDSSNNAIFTRFDDLAVFQNGANLVGSAQVNNFNNGLNSIFGGGTFLESQINANAETGNNWTKRNTNEDCDPYVLTGPATSNANVSNLGGVNIFDSDGYQYVPQIPHFHFDFNLGEVWGGLYR